MQAWVGADACLLVCAQVRQLNHSIAASRFALRKAALRASHAPERVPRRERVNSERSGRAENTCPLAARSPRGRRFKMRGRPRCARRRPRS
eukprot:8754572-Alexandrium_andersonii.AAC.1